MIRSKVTMKSHDATWESMAETSWVHYAFHFELIFGYCVPQKLSPLPSFPRLFVFKLFGPTWSCNPQFMKRGFRALVMKE